MKRNERETIHPNTVWKFIKDDIEIKIIKGELKNADKLPSIAELAAEYNVSKTTAQKALENMYSESTITKSKGVGYFVMPYKKEKLRANHKKVFIKMLNNSFDYASELDLSNEDLQSIKKIILKRIEDMSSR